MPNWSLANRGKVRHTASNQPFDMPNQPVSKLPPMSRKQSAENINRAMSRFSLIVQILGELGEAHFPYPGDSDIRHGCERALTSILFELARIEIAPSGKPSKAEEIAQAWLHSSEARQLIDADILQRMQIFIDFILSPARQ